MLSAHHNPAIRLTALAYSPLSQEHLAAAMRKALDRRAKL